MAPLELIVGDVKVVARYDVSVKCPRDSTLASILKEKKGGKCKLNSNERDGRCLSYVLHYLATGDLIYPLHEGFHRVDVLLKEMTYYGLVDDVLRSAKCESGSESTRRKRRSRSGESGFLSKSLSLSNVINTTFSESSTSISQIENEVKGHAETRSNRARFLGLLKRYLSLKSGGAKENPFGGRGQNFTHPQLPVGGVFRPGSAHGSTIILLAERDHVTIFGLKNDLALLFPYDDVISLRMTSSAFINCQITIDINQWRDEKNRPNNQSAVEFLNFLYNRRIKKFGFVLTVQLQWPDPRNKDFHHQWLLHRKSQTRLNSAGRKSSAVQRFFHKSSFSLNSGA